MKPNVVGIVGGVIAFISLVLPWWTETMRFTLPGSASLGQSIYLYQATLPNAVLLPIGVQLDSIWYGWTALYLLVFSGFLGIMGSFVRTRLILVAGGLLALFSVLVFAAGLESQLSPVMSLFFSSTIEYFNYTAYLSFGFWLALISAIIMLVASVRKPKVIPPPPPTPSLEKLVSEKEAGTSCLRNKEVA